MSVHPIVAALKEAREERGLSLNQVAHDAGVRPSTLCEWEHGRHSPTMARLDRVARALGKRVVLTDVV